MENQTNGYFIQNIEYNDLTYLHLSAVIKNKAPNSFLQKVDLIFVEQLEWNRGLLLSEK